MQTALTVRWGRGFTGAMDALRRDGWFAGQIGASTDEFDPISYHLAVAIAGVPVGLIRTTLAPPSVLHAWSGGRFPLRAQARVAELTRGVVAPSVRRLGIYRLAMLESLLRLRSLGATVAIGAVELDFVGRQFLAGLGFVEIGDPIQFDDRPRRGTVAQCLELSLDLWREVSWRQLREALIGRLDEAGYRVDSDLETAPAEAAAALV